MLEKWGAKQEKGQFFIELNPKDHKKIINELKDKKARLITISGLDDGILKAIYHFELNEQLLHLFVPLDSKKPKIDSITKAYPNASFYERELAEMFNIKVKGHPDLRPLFLSKDMQGKAPLRKSIEVKNQ